MQVSTLVLLFLKFALQGQAAAAVGTHANLPTESADSRGTDDDFILTSTSLPLDRRLMPEIGNGYLATATQSDTLYLAGVFNGAGGDSHRARIPAAQAFDMRVSGSSGPVTNENYTLNMRSGVFDHMVEGSKFGVLHRQYAHRTLKNAVVNELKLVWSSGGEAAVIEIVPLCPSVTTSDFFLQEVVSSAAEAEAGKATSKQDSTRLFRGSTVVPEAAGYTTQSVCFMFDVLPNTIQFEQSDVGKSVYFLMIAASSDNEGECLAAYKIATAAAKDGSLWAMHEQAWEQLWDSGSVRLFSEEKAKSLAKAVISGQYYIFASLSTDTDRSTPANALSPGGLAHGAKGADYQGHAFWDQETWMYPPILYMQSRLAARLLEYRVARLGSAQQIAKSFGNAGARYPWESAHSGLEACPSWASDVSNREVHISGDVALALQQYLYLTNDTNWYFATVPPSNFSPFDAQLELARYWASRASAVTVQGKVYYGVYHVMPPDEYQNDVNNSVFTNKVASIALAAPYDCWTFAYPNRAPTNELLELKRMSEQMIIGYDPVRDYHPEYDGYPLGQVVKQADTILLYYPLLHRDAEAGYTTMRNDLIWYEQATDAGGPGMTYMMYAIVWLSVASIDSATEAMIKESRMNADRLMGRCLPYIKAPFNVHTENADGSGAVNLITGYGGVLQAFINGYLGLRLLRDRLDFLPVLGDGMEAIQFSNLDYLGCSISVEVRANETAVTLRKSATALALYIYSSKTYVKLTTGSAVTVPNERFAVVAQQSSAADKPAFMRYNYIHGLIELKYSAGSVPFVFVAFCCVLAILLFRRNLIRSSRTAHDQRNHKEYTKVAIFD